MIMTLTYEQRWAFVANEVDTICKNTSDHSLADCLKAVLKEFDASLVIEIAYQIWRVDGERNLLIDSAFNNICTAIGKEGEYARRTERA